jgi:hypothetical protein
VSKSQNNLRCRLHTMMHLSYFAVVCTVIASKRASNGVEGLSHRCIGVTSPREVGDNFAEVGTSVKANSDPDLGGIARIQRKRRVDDLIRWSSAFVVRPAAPGMQTVRINWGSDVFRSQAVGQTRQRHRRHLGHREPTAEALCQTRANRVFRFCQLFRISHASPILQNHCCACEK